MKSRNGSPNGHAAATCEQPEPHLETISLDAAQYDELHAYLTSEASEDPKKLLAFFASTESAKH